MDGLKLTLFLAQIFTLVCTLVVALHPNILYATVSLLFAFLGVAVMFVYAGADFLAGTQVIVYVGGVTILILFAIMLTQWLYKLRLRDVRDKMVIPFFVLMIGLVPFLYKGLQELANQVIANPPKDLGVFAMTPKTNQIGTALLTTYVLPFEGITILLLGALVGSVWLARPR